MLDPNERTQALREALQSGRGWQRKLKRGTHTLRWVFKASCCHAAVL